MSLSGSEWVKLVNPKKASRSMTTNVKSRNHCREIKHDTTEWKRHEGRTGRRRIGRSYLGTETLWDFMTAFEAFLTSLRTFIEDGGDDEESWTWLAMVAHGLRMGVQEKRAGGGVSICRQPLSSAPRQCPACRPARFPMLSSNSGPRTGGTSPTYTFSPPHRTTQPFAYLAPLTPSRWFLPRTRQLQSCLLTL